MNYKFITIKKLEHWTAVTLNRPEVKNAFHTEMIQELTSVFQDLSKDQDTKIILLRGEGTAFCAGADLGWMKQMVNYTARENKQDSEKLWNMFESIRTCTKPVITIVHGAVFGGGLGLVACSDYVFAESQTQFCFSEVRLGLAPAVISSFTLKKISFGFAHAKMIFGQTFNSVTASQCGLVTEVFNGSLPDVAISSLVKNNGPQAMIESKKMLLELNFDPDWARKKDLTTSLIANLRASTEAQKKLTSFLSKSSKT